ncbi:class A beta-lactamase [Longispora sp. NPDC051575]|uniref:class A beta-lactamase n=1 Tax=Longispora sp. NPDC051575 TaxID=3154943 RepID=UPI00342AF43F
MSTRRTFLTAGAAVAVGALGTAGTAAASPSATAGLRGRLRRLERAHDARIGAYGHNLRTGAIAAYRADELFPMCSVFKTLAAAAVLRAFGSGERALSRTVRYNQADIDRAGYSPVTSLPGNLADGMTIGELCAAALSHSDNTAANLLLAEVDGPAAVTRLCRALGDPVTRLDRWESELNSAEPWRREDTTSPRAVTDTYRRLLLGTALDGEGRTLLGTWLRRNTTNGDTFRAGLPADWVLADKTGSGEYGTRNDVGVAWTSTGTPIALAVLTTHTDAAARPDNALVAATAAHLAAALT